MPAQLSQELVTGLSSQWAKEGLVSEMFSLPPPNSVSCKGTDTGHCRWSLVSSMSHEVLLTWPHVRKQNYYKTFLNGSSCFLCMTQY